MNKKLLLLVEDNEKVQKYNKQMLEHKGFAVETATTLESAAAFLQIKKPSAIILDIGMPDGSGLDFLRSLRQTSKVPVLLLTGFGEAKDVVIGFESGCDDYLPKPYTFEVLLARLNRLLKSSEQLPDSIIKGELTILIPSNEVFISGKKMRLTQNEFSLLLLFVQNEDKLISGEFLYESVWGQKLAGNYGAIRNAIYKLRKKLVLSGYTIYAEWGEGYCFQTE